MNEFLQSLRSDLLSRRMLPLVALAVLALAVGIGYALGGTGSSSTPRPSVAAGGSFRQPALTVVAASANPNAAESETPGGVRYQSGGVTRDPFTPLPEPKSATAKTSGSSSSGSSSAGGSSGGSGASGSGGTGGKSSGSEPAPTPPKPSKPSKPNKKAFPYDVSILFGRLPATAGQEVTLPPYQNLQPQRPLPSAGDERIALERVSSNAKSAVFALLAPAILRGQGLCVPSPSECQHLSLEVGHTEELEYIEEDGQSFVYALKTVSVVKRSSQTAG